MESIGRFSPAFGFVAVLLVAYLNQESLLLGYIFTQSLKIEIEKKMFSNWRGIQTSLLLTRFAFQFCRY